MLAKHKRITRAGQSACLPCSGCRERRRKGMDERHEARPNSNTYVIDSEEAAELARLMQQDRILTEALGGLFPEGRLLPEDGCLLDLACGPGGWALEVAF